MLAQSISNNLWYSYMKVSVGFINQRKYIMILLWDLYNTRTTIIMMIITINVSSYFMIVHKQKHYS